MSANHITHLFQEAIDIIDLTSDNEDIEDDLAHLQDCFQEDEAPQAMDVDTDFPEEEEKEEDPQHVQHGQYPNYSDDIVDSPEEGKQRIEILSNILLVGAHQIPNPEDNDVKAPLPEDELNFILEDCGELRLSHSLQLLCNEVLNEFDLDKLPHPHHVEDISIWEDDPFEMDFRKIDAEIKAVLLKERKPWEDEKHKFHFSLCNNFYKFNKIK